MSKFVGADDRTRPKVWNTYRLACWVPDFFLARAGKAGGICVSPPLPNTGTAAFDVQLPCNALRLWLRSRTPWNRMSKFEGELQAARLLMAIQTFVRPLVPL